jgi:hypothetical protein
MIIRARSRGKAAISRCTSPGVAGVVTHDDLRRRQLQEGPPGHGVPRWAEWTCLRAAAYDSPVFAARDRTQRLRFLLLVM